MRLMNIRVKYPQKSLSNPGARKYILPYLLRGLDIVKTNQVWSIDISYIPMKQGFMYLTAIMDVQSATLWAGAYPTHLRKVFAWIWLKSRSESMVHRKSSTPTRVFNLPIRLGSKRLKKWY